jgi:hypothetical protein
MNIEYYVFMNILKYSFLSKNITIVSKLYYVFIEYN